MTFLLGPDTVAAGTDESLRLLDLPAAWVVVLVVLPVFALLAWMGYARESLSRPLRSVLVVLRLGAFLLLGLVLARPVHVERREAVHPAEVVVLLDDSASMRRSDSYGDEGTRRALEQASKLDSTVATRSELARAVVERELMPVWRRNGYEVHLYGFSESASPVTDLSAL